jgi:peptidoglycan/xylan/chitin deacetylase (PgdA/CDA1 family)
MRIGSHGIDHRDLAALSSEDLRRELLVSRVRLSAICARSVDAIGIPFGSYNSRVLRAIAEAGYTEAYTSDGLSFDPHAFLKPRTSICEHTGDDEVEAILTADMAPLRRLRRSIGMMRKQIAGRLTA